jgi:coenzyme F420-dependent glucose-6-phosphate dehydrogenase
MGTIGYHAPHERFAPSELLKYVGLAGRSGFEHAMCSDHFHPWSLRQGQSGYTWSWLGAALEGSDLSLGTVTAPGQRYHPAIIAQAAATLEEMFPNRFWLALGTGQLLNEGITGETWPSKPERRARLGECVEIMRALWAGETVSHRGRVTVQEAKLFSLPRTAPKLFGAALTVETARWCGQWADGLITGSSDSDSLRQRIDAFREAAGSRKPVYIQASFLLAANKEEGISVAHENWSTNVLGDQLQAELRTPEMFDAAARFVSSAEVEKSVRISNSPEEFMDWLGKDFETGADRVYLHHVGRDQERFLAFMGEHLTRQFVGPDDEFTEVSSDHRGVAVK